MRQVTSSGASRAAQATSTPAVAAPRTRADLEALSQLRSELRDELSALTRQRSELVAQQRFGGEESRAATAARIAALDARSAALDQRIQAADEAISQAISRGLAGGPRVEVPRVEVPRVTMSVPPFFPSRSISITPILIANGATLALMAVLFWAMVRRRLRGGSVPPVIADQGRRLEQLQQAVDTMAVEIERISEGQRYVTKVLAERLPATTERTS